MSSRYGRNQKRRHLAEVAALQARIEKMMGPWQRAISGDFEIDPRYVVSRELTEREESHYRIEREHQLIVRPYEELNKLIFNHDTWKLFANYKGFSWIVTATFSRMSNNDFAHMSIMPDYRIGQEHFELKLMGYAPSNRDLLSPGI